MSNLPEKNYPEFNRVARVLRERGHQVKNPAENFDGDQTRKWSEYMRIDIDSLLIVDAVVVLNGWEYSTGAKLEVAVAQALEIPIYEVEDFLKSRRPTQIHPAVYISVTP